ncbi:hypothetical protein ASO20_00300 [Mycoplasma sp. (ex Biomphalaria glabrata)]|uniref:5'-methylthioadenosine/S-adenosylhomocysteine nucleosidase n=1 Tax=Mycoplasma sp. (ex Biomphalaria glabrata) TaxID=1749074 RepID=UPI00073A6164|nr:5'-methylthioadenosine/S-adenosylhomocysteine nucleosidase [Mycoplasma sp. (ex Biomphalaria glabrata)]ALV23122.1 hypothetical protein ASO20_00300 [Mycoplasma sp. (ex Biomphalaria glabrata)]
MYLFVCAMESEIITFLEKSKPTEVFKSKNFNLYKKNNHYFLITGIGKVNAAFALTHFLTKYNEGNTLKGIINIGVCGSVNKKLSICDVVMIDKAYYHDFDLTMFGYKYGQVPGSHQFFEPERNLHETIRASLASWKPHSCNLATGDVFVQKHNYFNELKIKHNIKIDVVDMEGTSYFHVAEKLTVPFIAIKIISDYIESDNNSNQYSENMAHATKIIQNIIERIINE